MLLYVLSFVLIAAAPLLIIHGIILLNKARCVWTRSVHKRLTMDGMTTFICGLFILALGVLFNVLGAYAVAALGGHS